MAALLTVEEIRTHLRLPQGYDEDLVSDISEAVTDYVSLVVEEPIAAKTFELTCYVMPGSNRAITLKQRRVKPDTLTVKYWTTDSDGQHLAPDGEIAHDKLRLDPAARPYPMLWPLECWPRILVHTPVKILGTAEIDEEAIPPTWKRAGLQLAGYFYDNPNVLSNIPRLNAVDMMLRPSAKYA